ncbi:uncharacterized protein LOC112454615, partial [Temnothorax curvispinosus]|uniref:ATP-dependent DNA helicase n=1 Tax=Temnothorax curvispinosus TaxID=300111 RepID=A0A6J1PSB8_9HYME
MTIGHALTAVDKLLKDLMKNSQPFGGKVILFAGDFRQNLPIVPHAHKAAIIESTVKYNPIWRNVNQVKLQQNMRTGEEKKFASWLLELGEGKLSNTDGLHPETIEIPQDFISKGSLITEIFGDKINMEQIKVNYDRVILCPKNEDTFKINDEILCLMEGETKEYLSIDSIVLTAPARSQIVFLPRIDFLSNDSELPFKLKQRQFPIRMAFTMTINKSQGQTLEKVGIYLPQP